MHTRLLLALGCALILLRIPSIAQPMGADQGLYAYVGERVLVGEVPYRDAWDQKPPAIHYIYALLWAIWPNDSVVAAADLLAAAAAAILLVSIGTSLVSRTTGSYAALIFLLLSDPGFQRLSGVAARGQCETFIAVAMTGVFALLCAANPTRWKTVAAGVLLGLAISLKYNAVAYAGAVLLTLWIRKRLERHTVLHLAGGVVVVPGILVLIFTSTDSVGALYAATVQYNLEYSGETYQGPLDFVRYLLSFPITHARTDALWLVGGLGCAVLLASSPSCHDRLIAPAWVAAACLSIAINSSRGLPQYFVQALPALALAGAWAATLVSTRPFAHALVLLMLSVGVWRVNDFPKWVENIRFDARRLSGHLSEREYLERFGDRERRKYSALAIAELVEFIRLRTSATDRILVFGFSPGAYVLADRASASRFFWSRPVIVNFNAHEPGYGVSGLLADVKRYPPAVVALQQRDWWPDVENSAEFFLRTPDLARWLHDGYQRVTGPEGFDTWVRRIDAR